MGGIQESKNHAGLKEPPPSAPTKNGANVAAPVIERLNAKPMKSPPENMPEPRTDDSKGAKEVSLSVDERRSDGIEDCGKSKKD